MMINRILYQSSQDNLILEIIDLSYELETNRK